MRMISYAWNREDVLLRRAFRNETSGFYVDVGAGDPEGGSLTKHFYDRGWRGINVEPSRLHFERLCIERDRDINLNIAISDRIDDMTFYECSPPAFSGLSTLDREQAMQHRANGISVNELLIEVDTLSRIFERHVDGTIDFLSVDVEGWEHHVLKGNDWERWRPRVVVAEATKPNTTIPSHQAWEQVLIDVDYEFANFDGLNRFYVRAEDSQLRVHFNTPVNVFDDFEPFEYARQIRELQAKAQSLEDEVGKVRDMRDGAAQYALSLEGEVGKLRAMRDEAARYALSLEEELERIRSSQGEPISSREGSKRGPGRRFDFLSRWSWKN